MSADTIWEIREDTLRKMEQEIERLREREKQAAELLRDPRHWDWDKDWREKRDQWLKDAGID